MPKKGGLGQFADLREGLARTRGWCFRGGVDTPMHTMSVIVQRVKVSVAILSDLNLLPYQTAIIQLRNFNKDMYKL